MGTDRFKPRHVNFVRLAGGECIARLEAEKGNPQASIWVGGVGLDHITAKSKGLTTPYVSRYASKTPDTFKDPEHYYIGLYVGPLTFVTNLDRAKELGLEVPHSWADLLKPQYKGYIRMANPNSSGTAYNVLTTMARPESLRLTDAHTGNIEATVKMNVYLGNTLECYLHTDFGEVLVQVDDPHSKKTYQEGEACSIDFSPDRVRLLNANPE